MKKLLKVCLFFSLLNVVLPSYSADSPEKYLKKAKDFLKDYRFEPAIEMGNLALIAAKSSLPLDKHLDYHIFAGKIALLQEEFQKAKEIFEKSIALLDDHNVKNSNKKKCNLKNYLAITLMKMKKYDLAILELKETIDLYRETYKGRNLTISVPVINLAETYKLKGDLLNAEDRYLEAAELRSGERKIGDAQMLIKSGLAAVYASMGKIEKSKELLAEISSVEVSDSSVAVDIFDNIALAYAGCSDANNEKLFIEKADAVAAKVFPVVHSRNKK